MKYCFLFERHHPGKHVSKQLFKVFFFLFYVFSLAVVCEGVKPLRVCVVASWFGKPDPFVNALFGPLGWSLNHSSAQRYYITSISDTHHAREVPGTWWQNGRGVRLEDKDVWRGCAVECWRITVCSLHNKDEGVNAAVLLLMICHFASVRGGSHYFL